jgi:hypothetical protein
MLCMFVIPLLSQAVTLNSCLSACRYVLATLVTYKDRFLRTYPVEMRQRFSAPTSSHDSPSIPLNEFISPL